MPGGGRDEPVGRGDGILAKDVERFPVGGAAQGEHCSACVESSKEQSGGAVWCACGRC